MSSNSGNPPPSLDDSLLPDSAGNAALSLLLLASSSGVASGNTAVGAVSAISSDISNTHPDCSLYWHISRLAVKQRYEVGLMMVVDSATGQNAHPQPALLSRQLEDLAAADATVEDAIEINDLEEEGEEGSVSRPSIEAIQVGTSFGGQINGGEDLPSPLHILEILPYRDLSNISYEEVEAMVNDPENELNFPTLLHHAISHHSDSIVWLEHGRAFIIVNADTFFGQVTPQYFCTNDPEIFMKWIEKYGFQQFPYVLNGGDTIMI